MGPAGTQPPALGHEQRSLENHTCMVWAGRGYRVHRKAIRVGAW
jgi:hypothetical protein